MPSSRAGLFAALAIALVAPAATSAAVPAGTPVQLQPPSACIGNTATGGCVGAGQFARPRGLAVAPGGTDLYVNSQSGGVRQFVRDAATGALTPGAAISRNQFAQGVGVAVSPSGAFVAAASGDPGSNPSAGFVDVFTRSATGALAAGGCASEIVAFPGCPELDGIGAANAVAWPPSGPGIYVAGSYGGGGAEGALAVLSVNPATGALGQLQCLPAQDSPVVGDACNVIQDEPGLEEIEQVVVTPDGGHVYAYTFRGVLGFTRNPATGMLGGRVACVERFSPEPTCDGPEPRIGVGGGMAVAPDGRSLYVGGRGTGGLTVLSRQPASGALAVLECFNEAGSQGCTKVDGMDAGSGDVAVSPDGTLVLVAGSVGLGATGELRTFRRDTATGRLAPLACTSVAGQPGCVSGAGMFEAYAPAFSPDGRHAYLASIDGTAGGDSGALAAFRLAVAPTCQGASVSVAAGATVTLPLVCADGDGDAVTRVVAGAPAQGTLGAIDQAAGTVGYTAAATASGSDTVTFTGSDGANTSAPAAIAIAVTPRADQPPSSRITAPRGAKLRARKVKAIRGTARDDKGVTRVQIVVQRLARGAKAASAAKLKPRCRRLARDGRLHKAKVRRGTCALTGFLPVKGTTAWKLKLKRRLPAGKYAMFSRATDTVGRRETAFSARAGNRVRVTLR
jgi:DNA-binding beta-propeller fold protein YncE